MAFKSVSWYLFRAIPEKDTTFFHMDTKKDAVHMHCIFGGDTQIRTGA